MQQPSSPPGTPARRSPLVIDHLLEAARAAPDFVSAARSMGLSGDQAVLAADRALIKTYGLSLLTFFGIRQIPRRTGGTVVPIRSAREGRS